MTLNLKSLSNRVGSVLDDQNQIALKQVLENLSQITEHFATKSNEIDSSFDKLHTFLEEFTKVGKAMPGFMNHMDNTIGSINKVAQSVHTSTKQFNSTMKTTSNFMQNMTHEVTPLLTKSIEQLNEALININTLTRELNNDPSVLVRGKISKKYAPGESPR